MLLPGLAYVKRFDKFDDACGSHAHHLSYFLKGASEAGNSIVRNPDDTHLIKAGTKACTDFADYVVKHEEDLSEGKFELAPREIREFVGRRNRPETKTK